MMSINVNTQKVISLGWKVLYDIFTNQGQHLLFIIIETNKIYK
jgi:hypothetical protein